MSSFYEFFIDAFEVLHHGDTLDNNWHIKILCDALQQEFERWKAGEVKQQDIIINVPPRTLKSSIVSVAFPVWCWVHSPGCKIIGSSYASSLSIELNVKARRLCESLWFQQMFGDGFVMTSDQNTKGYYENSRGGFRRATSTGSAITGTGGDIIIVDDPLNPEQAASRKERESANNYFDTTLSTRLNHPEVGFFIVIMQRLHANDLTGHLLKKEPGKWKHICLPAEDSEHVKPLELREMYVDGLLFPGRLSPKFLQSQSVRLGSYGYAGQFKQLPSDPEGGIIKKSWFKIISWAKFIEMSREIQGVEEPKWVWDSFVDTAFTEDEANDPTATLVCTSMENDLFIRWVDTQHLEFPALIKHLPKLVKAHGYTNESRVYVEPKASGKSVVQQTKKETDLNIIEAEPPKDDKLVRATAVSPIIESGRVWLIDGEWVPGYLDELGEFPKSEHDDRVDVTVMAINKKLIKPVVPARFNFPGRR